MRWIVGLLLLATVAGCADESKVAVQPVAIVASTFCETVREKLTWDIKDTRPTINGIRRLNAKWDAQCAGKGK